MRRIGLMLLLAAAVFAAPAAWAKSDEIFKVLPEFVDQEGRTSLSPSLYERDAYQARLRREPSQQSGIAFFVNWKAKKTETGRLKLRVEIRGVLGRHCAPDPGENHRQNPAIPNLVHADSFRQGL